MHPYERAPMVIADKERNDPRKGNAALADRDAGGYARWQASLRWLASMPEAELAKIDIERLNMFCTAGLPGIEGIDPDACISRLDKWTKYIANNTNRWYFDYVKSPREGEDSPGKFRMMALASLLQRQLKVHYNMPFTEGDYDGRDSRNLFLHGLLTGCGGTCVTLPVLYIAIGRKLGYPLFLVKTRDHFFARWDEPGGERFNVECACRGFASHSDEHYCTWRAPISQADLQRGVLLRNLSRREELASFLNERGSCLVDHLRMAEALEAYHYAYQIAPYDRGIRGSRDVASFMQRTLEIAQMAAERKGVRSFKISEMPYPEPRDAHEAWALPHAKETFARILRIQSNGNAAASAS